MIPLSRHPADLTLTKRPRTSYRIKIHFAVFNHVYLLFSFMKLVETLQSSSVKRILSPPEISNRIILNEKLASLA